MEYLIIPMPQDLWPAVRDLYADGIATGNATFETDLPDWEHWDSSHLKSCRLVALDKSPENVGEGQFPPAAFNVLGWAALSPVSPRRVYRGVAEVSVYVAAAARGRGIGKALLKALVLESEVNGLWTLQASIFPENVASIRVHKSCGFRQVGIRHKIGKLGDRWRDTVLLERRSTNTGV
jgi:phosphinothricin acetyltransferase